jgi:acyl-CoA synthetase (AMP-forming)/AMP-acid ligase II
MMTAVIGEQDEKRGESVKAVVVPKDPRLLGTEEAMEFAKRMAQTAAAAGLASSAAQLPEVMPWPSLEALESELKQHCAGHLAQFKRPRRFEFRPELPIGPTGKVMKKLL